MNVFIIINKKWEEYKHCCMSNSTTTRLTCVFEPFVLTIENLILDFVSVVHIDSMVVKTTAIIVTHVFSRHISFHLSHC